MPYVSSGNVVDSRNASWSIWNIPAMFWGLVNFIVLFFQTMINPGGTSRGDNYRSDYRASGRGPDPFGPGGGPRRRMGGFRGGGGPSPPPMAGGG